MKYITTFLVLLTLTLSIGFAESQPPCRGILKQGGILLCEFPEGTIVRLTDRTVKVDSSGLAVFGLRQLEKTNLKLEATLPGRRVAKIFELSIQPREDDYREIDGLECDTIDARTDEQKAHVARSYRKKVKAFARFEKTLGLLGGFELPTNGKPSSPYGPTRKYKGVSEVTGKSCEKTSVHRGYDIAAPTGTPVTAPASGVVVLADIDLYYEGGSVFIDHGQGLISVLLHMSEVKVTAGQPVEKGQVVGAVGNTGRSTGPHLHWGVKWRNASQASRKNDYYIDPALLMLNLEPVSNQN